MKNKLIVLFIVALLSVPSFAQEFNLSGEIRPRYENRYGFSSLRSEADKAGNFISQRSRINFDFKNEKMIFKVIATKRQSMGRCTSTLALRRYRLLHFMQAWGEGIISDKLRLENR